MSPATGRTATTEVAKRVVVYGDYPPFPTPGAAATLETVRSLLADGHQIEVVSPRPSAAHHHGDAGDPKGAAKLARLTGGAEFVARFDPGILGQSGRAAGPAAARAALGLAVRRAKAATILLSPLTAPPAGKWVRTILGPADRVVVASEGDAATLAAAGLDPTRISVSDTAWWEEPATVSSAATDGRPTDSWGLAAGAAREDIEAEVRRRAATDREDDAANPASASWPLHMLAPLAPAPTGSSKPLFRLVKRAVHRLVAWEVVPIVEQVNHLQRASIEALDRHTEAETVELQRRPTATGS